MLKSHYIVYLYLCRKYQKKISPELCSNLAQCLTNSINFEIVKGLMDIQHVTEKYLIHLRLKVTNKQQSKCA